MSVATLPPPVDIDVDTKKAIIDGLKRVLARLQEKGLADSRLAYQHLISDAGVLESFIDTFVEHRKVCDDIVLSKARQPVRDNDELLVCNVSLNQVQQLLVRTCAKRVFEADKTVHRVTETVTRKMLFGLIRKTEQVEVERVGNDPAEERKLRELSRYLAFGWQLPLLSAYREHLSYQQVVELADDILALPTPEAVATVGKFDAQTLRKVKQATGPDFIDILMHQPQAIAGIAVWNRDMYEFYRKLLAEAAWDFFARDKAFFNVVASLDKPAARAYGDVLSYIAAENLTEIQRLNIDKTEVLVTSLKMAMGPKLPLVLGHPGFAKDMLRKVVDNLLHMSQEKDKLMASFSLTCKAMVPTITEWLAKQGR
jgi:hypothetical protein